VRNGASAEAPPLSPSPTPANDQRASSKFMYDLIMLKSKSGYVKKKEENLGRYSTSNLILWTLKMQQAR
jgi:hypothetical protein